MELLEPSLLFWFGKLTRSVPPSRRKQQQHRGAPHQQLTRLSTGSHWSFIYGPVGLQHTWHSNTARLERPLANKGCSEPSPCCAVNPPGFTLGLSTTPIYRLHNSVAYLSIPGCQVRLHTPQCSSTLRRHVARLGIVRHLQASAWPPSQYWFVPRAVALSLSLPLFPGFVTMALGFLLHPKSHLNTASLAYRDLSNSVPYTTNNPYTHSSLTPSSPQLTPMGAVDLLPRTLQLMLRFPAESSRGPEGQPHTWLSRRSRTRF